MSIPALFLDPNLATPLLVYDRAALVRAWEKFQTSGAERVLYALKACYRPPVLKTLRELGAGAEVMTEMEYDLALAAGFRAEDVLVNGLGRTPDFLSRLTREGARIVLDTWDEFETVRALGKPARLGVRLAPELPTREPYGRPSKLGLTANSAQFQAILRHCAESPELQLELLHLHAASGQTNSDLFLDLLEQLPLESFSILDLGGGWESASDVEDGELQRLAAGVKRRWPEVELWLEPGRALVNGAALVVTTVRACKTSRGRNYLVLDAPTSTLMPHKEATYRLLHPQPGTTFQADLVDGITSLTSTIKADLGFAERPQVGQRLVLGECGAYTSAMAQFWAFPPIPVSFLQTPDQLVPDLTPHDLAQARRLLLKG